MIKAYRGPGCAQTPSALANPLTLAPARLARLEYMGTAWAADNPGTPLPAAASVTRSATAAFEQRYPGFPAWLAANAERLERENPPLKMK